MNRRCLRLHNCGVPRVAQMPGLVTVVVSGGRDRTGPCDSVDIGILVGIAGSDEDILRDRIDGDLIDHKPREGIEESGFLA